MRSLQNLDRRGSRSRARLRGTQRVEVAGCLLIARFNGFFKFGDCFGEAPLIGQNPDELIVRQTQPGRGRQRPPVERGGAFPGSSGFGNSAQVDGGLVRRSRFGETLGLRAKDAEVVVGLGVRGVALNRVGLRRFRPRPRANTGINRNRNDPQPSQTLKIAVVGQF